MPTRSIRNIYELLGGGKHDAGLDSSLRPVAHPATVPGTTHYNILATGIVAEVILPFLNNEHGKRLSQDLKSAQGLKTDALEANKERGAYSSASRHIIIFASRTV